MDEREAELAQFQTPEVVGQITSLVRPVQLSKDAMEGSAEQIADLVKSGHANPLDVSTKIAWMINVLEKARKLIQEDSVDEIEKHNGKANINGAKVEKAETGTTYDYAGCGDHVWDANDALAKSAAEARKAREKFLRALTGPLTEVNTDTGAVDTINPPVKSSTTNIKISFE